MRDNLLRWIEITASRIQQWALRWREERGPEWVKGYKEWKKKN